MMRLIVFSLSFFVFCSVAIAEDVEMLIAKAQSGDAAAQFQLVKVFEKGIGTPKDQEKAKYWLYKAAENGHPEAQYWAGYNYEHGQGVTADLSKALQWFEKSANQGYAPSQFMAGMLYQMGPVIGGNLQQQNPEKSIYWYNLAAQQESRASTAAQFFLGCLKYFGFGIAKNQAEGEELILKASNKGEKRAQRFLENKENADPKELQKICEIYPPRANNLIRPRQDIVVEKKGNITNARVVGNLASKQDIGCISIEKAKNSFTPADLYKGVATCLAQEKFEEASALFLLAGLYSHYDAARITDKTAGQAGSVLVMNTFSNIPTDIKAKFGTAVEKYTKDPTSIQRICEQVAVIGPPDYYPEYMIRHGMKAFTGSPHEGAIASDFDKTSTWTQLQTKYLRCK